MTYVQVIPRAPFPEAGRPVNARVSADGMWLDMRCTVPAPGFRSRVAVYRADDFSLRELLDLEQYVESTAFHPVLPLLAIGTEAGDDSERRGQLVLYEPGSRHRVTVSFPDVGVTEVHWLDEHRLELTLAEPDRHYERDGEDGYVQCVVERDEWLGVTGEIGLGPRTAVDVDNKYWTSRGSRRWETLTALAPGWSPRRAVTAVEGLRDGRMIAALDEGVLLECWSPSGAPLWSAPVPDEFLHRSGNQLYVAPDEETAWVAVHVGDSADRKTLLRRLSLADGEVLAERRLGFPAAFASRADGAWAARDSRELFPPARWPPSETPVFTPTGRQLASVALGECDSSYAFRVRRSPHLLFLLGVGDGPHPEKWVAEATPRGVGQLFPLRWDPERSGPVRGAFGAYVVDGLGPGLVHTCVTGDGTDGTYVVRRAFPRGDTVWAYRVDAEVTGLDAHAGLVHVVTRARELLTLRAADGEVAGRRPTSADGHVFTPTSLGTAPGGEVLIGTAEGRILVPRRAAS
ncbi:hypothetical protein [Streptomyces sp. UNOC14_S4]|uniref:hypothetical protein n=1 Tax=Streptomyces sp. UNOC14_S4 TaxID=2872340 RepID=UPI001E4A6440|nr:hypothetical protein [Streptomyces sp. UNOC14_S4]MCC3769652.1 hypothetical protein [Streptomyces sp. UNOC14_S4]